MTVDDLHAVVLAYGSGAEHVPLVESLLEQGLARDHVLVVHNPSASGEDPVPPPGGSVIRMQRNLGYAAGMNAGIRRALAAEAEAVLALTNDTRVRPGTIGRLVEAAAGAPPFGILGPALWSRRHERFWSYGNNGLPSDRAGHRAEPPPVGADRIAECDWIDGSAMILRRRMVEDVGLFDERYFMYYEETDLCLRARRAGWKVGVVIDAVAEQRPGITYRRGAYAYLSTRNGLEHARRAHGARGVMHVMDEKLARSWRFAKWFVKAPRDPLAREEVPAELAGIWTGIAHFARRRWGPPPRWLPGLGDLDPR